MNRVREQHRIVTNVKDGAVRLSMTFCNDEDDLDKTVRAVARELNG